MRDQDATQHNTRHTPDKGYVGPKNQDQPQKQAQQKKIEFFWLTFCMEPLQGKQDLFFFTNIVILSDTSLLIKTYVQRV